MIGFTRAPSDATEVPFTWLPIREGGRETASVVCGRGHHGVIDTLYDEALRTAPALIADDGTVSPRVQCAMCDWTGTVRLVGWAGRAGPPPAVEPKPEPPREVEG